VAAKVLGVDHVAVAGTGLGPVLTALGLTATAEDVVAQDAVRVAFWEIGEDHIELLTPEPEGAGSVARYLARRGPGLHHLALAVEGLDDLLDELRRQGIRLLDDQPRPGSRGTRVAFVHPSAAGGVLLELVEHPPAAGR
jgi:methylmalonyl-CoA epimerase